MPVVVAPRCESRGLQTLQRAVGGEGFDCQRTIAGWLFSLRPRKGLFFCKSAKMAVWAKSAKLFFRQLERGGFVDMVAARAWPILSRGIHSVA
ncbi:hypothetical protein I41_33830 [Lacipirellula limnantheis]|uniref:Uncharacterized protein n=1 Tax=Lacipirellula limnantheis TaxID=2528024 RepID=A0A517U0M9_9BACT|nr:hypothetical protein I41_33830 [Lacipirellula limnantheis]